MKRTKKLIKKFWKSLGIYEKEFFKAYLFLWFIIGIVQILSFFVDIKDEWIRIFSNILTYEILIVIGWNIFVRTEVFEKWLLSNFSKLIFFLILLFLTLPSGFVDINKNVFYICGGLFTFWYGYKKYERDKELEIIETYGKRYDDLKSHNDYSGLLSLFEEEFYLYKKGYISKDLWKRIKHKIDKNLLRVIEKIIGEINGIEDYNKPSKYIPVFANDDLMCHWKGFGEYVINRLKEIQTDNEKIVQGKVKGSIYQNQDVIKNSKKIIATIRLLTPNIEEVILANKKYFNN